MGANHVISVELGAYLHVDTGRLMIREKNKDGRILNSKSFRDIGVLVLGDNRIVLTNAVLMKCAENGCAVVVCGEDYMPNSLMLPYGYNKIGADRPLKQFKNMDNERSKSLWAQVISSKIYGQLSMLYNYKLGKKAIVSLIDLASSDDTTSTMAREGQAAKLYWKEIFKHIGLKNKTREKLGATDVVNSSLNYGYAVIRSAVGRSVALNGLLPSIGIGHVRKDNPHNLVEDLMEPLRYVVDKVVLDMVDKGGAKFLDDDFGVFYKKHIVDNVLKSTLPILGKEYRLFEGIEVMLQSYVRCISGRSAKLDLPNIPSTQGRRKESDRVYERLSDLDIPEN